MSASPVYFRFPSIDRRQVCQVSAFVFQSFLLTIIREPGVNQKRSLQICRPESEEFVTPSSVDFPKISHCHFIYQQLSSQLSHDIWWISLAAIFITVAEADHYQSQPLDYSTFNIIFEVVSAYSCVGVSVGYPGKNYAFCGEWHTVSKLVLALVALRGRHRGLPVANIPLLHES